MRLLRRHHHGGCAIYHGYCGWNMYLTRSSRMIIDYGFLLPVLRVRYVTYADFYLPRLRYTVPHTRISVESQPCAFSGDSRQFEDILRTIEHRNRVACKCLHMQIESTRPSLQQWDVTRPGGPREGGWCEDIRRAENPFGRPRNVFEILQKRVLCTFSVLFDLNAFDRFPARWPKGCTRMVCRFII